VPPIALLYDIHGNVRALQAVLADASGAGGERFLLGGDYALFGPWPAETIDQLRSLRNATWIRGNVDRWTAEPQAAPEDELVRGAIEDCRRAMDESTVLELGALQEHVVLDGTFYCHASPVSDMESFTPMPADREDELLGGVQERRVVFGHTHLQFRRTRADDVELINPGSVGMPLDGDRRAAYALLFDDGSVELRRVPYDVESAVAGLAERFGQAPWAERSIGRLKSAQL
jgi:predicted phosphodiesterase